MSFRETWEDMNSELQMQSDRISLLLSLLELSGSNLIDWLEIVDKEAPHLKQKYSQEYTAAHVAANNAVKEVG